MFYHLTLNYPSGISLCVPGCYTSSERHSEFVLLRGPRIIELWILHPTEIKLMRVCKQDLYGEILSMKPLRPPGSERDYLVTSTKDGETLIFIFDLRHRCFIKVHTLSGKAQRPFQLPGHFVATDPRGRAFIMGAKENNIKSVYSVNMLDQNNLIVSLLPIESDKEVLHKGLTYDIIFLYDTIDRDIVSFASTEIVFQDGIAYYEKLRSLENFARLTQQQSINFFDIDLRTRKVRLRRREFLLHKSNFLVEVPGGNVGPGGVLLFSLNNVVYKRGEYSVTCPIPRKFVDTERLEESVLFINCTLYMKRGLFYYLAQTELGDIFKISLATGSSIELQMQYFCYLPLATTLYILEPDFLFVAYESGDHALYSIAGISINAAAEPVFSSIAGLDDDETFFFWPVNTKVPDTIQVIPSLCPIISMPIIKPCSLFAVCGSVQNYILKGIDHKLQICSLAEAKVDDWLQKREIPVKDLNVLWSCLHSVRLRNRDLIILSYTEKTVVFELKNGFIEKVDVPDISTSSNTLACKVLNNEVVVQITSKGIHTSYPDSKWRTPERTRVEACALNNVQVILLLDDASLQYVDIGEHADLTIHHDSLEDVENAQIILLSNDTDQADFSLIGTHSNSVLVISLRPDTMFQCVFKIDDLGYSITSFLSCRIGHQEPGKLKIFIGLANGDLSVTYMDKSNGSLSELKKYHLGTDPLKLFDCGDMVMMLTNYTWLFLLDDGKVVLKRFYAGIIETGCNFREPTKFFLFSHPILRLVYVADLNTEMMFKPIVPIQFDRKNIGFLRIIPSTLPLKSKTGPSNLKIRFLFYTQHLEKEIPDPDGVMESSLLHIFHPFEPYEHFCVELRDAVSCSFAFVNELDPLFRSMFVCSAMASEPWRGVLQMLILGITDDGKLLIDQLDRFELKGVPTAIEPFGAGVLIGIGKEMLFYCNSEMKLKEDCKCYCAHTSIASITTNGNNILVKDAEKGIAIVKYNVVQNQLKVFAHDPTPVAFCCFFGPDCIAKTDLFGNITIVKYTGLLEIDATREEEELIEFESDGPEIHLNLPHFDVKYTGVKTYPMTEEELLELMEFESDGPKEIRLTHFSVGELILSMQMASIYIEGQPVLLYSTISGGIGMIAYLGGPVSPYLAYSKADNVIPESDEQEIERVKKVKELEESDNKKRRENEYILVQLEKFMLLQDPVVSQDPLTFRATHNSVKKLVNGDLCEQYVNLGPDAQNQFAKFLKVTPEEIIFRLVELRSNFLL